MGEATHKVVSEAWKKAGMEETVSEALVSKIRSDLGLAGNVRKAASGNGATVATKTKAAEKAGPKLTPRRPGRASKNGPMNDLEGLFTRLARSDFRSRFRLRAKEQDYLKTKGLDTVLEHAEKFIGERLVPADPPNDGRQTPMRNHPVFVAQHATATCCRGCLAKWHGIPKGHALTGAEKTYILSVIRRWLVDQDRG